MFLTLNLKSPTGGFAYGIPSKAINVLPLNDSFLYPSMVPRDIVTEGGSLPIQEVTEIYSFNNSINMYNNNKYFVLFDYNLNLCISLMY